MFDCVCCQVRSIGSHAAEAKFSGSRRRLDIFALDLLEEMTAIHGSMVWRQVHTILLYYYRSMFYRPAVGKHYLEWCEIVFAVLNGPGHGSIEPGLSLDHRLLVRF